jgi:hypothetical protein
VLSAQNPTERRQLRRNRDGRSGNSTGRDDAGDIQDTVSVKGGDVDRLAELPGKLLRGRDDRGAVPVRLQHRASQPKQPPAEPVSPARHALHQAGTRQLLEQLIPARLGDPYLGSNLSRTPIGPLDREKIKNIGGPANATHSPTIPSPVAPPTCAGHATERVTADTDRELSPVPLMQLATGFWTFKTLAAAHELDLFSRLSGTPGTTAGGLAGALAIEERPAEMLLTACAALGLLVKNDGRYLNSPIAEEFLVRGKPYYFGGFVQMLDQRLYPGVGPACRSDPHQPPDHMGSGPAELALRR